MAPRTAVHETMTDRRGSLDVAYLIVDAWPKPLGNGELTLKQLASPSYSAERIARDDKERGVGGHVVAATGTNLLLQRLSNASVLCIRSLCGVSELRFRRYDPYPQRTKQRQNR